MGAVDAIESGTGHTRASTNGSKCKKVYTFDEAIQEARIGKCQTILIVLTGMAVMGTVVENIAVSLIFPYARCDLNLTTIEQGILGSVSYLGVVCTSHIWGFLADTWGRQKVLFVATSGGFVFSLFSGIATNTTVLILLRFIAGSFLAGTQAGAYSYISEFHTYTKASIAAAMVSIFINGELIHLALSAIFILPMDWEIEFYPFEFKPWRLFLVINSFLNLWNAFVFYYLPESPKFLLAMNRKIEALNVLSRVYAINTGNDKESFAVKDIAYDSLGNNLSNVNGFFSISALIWRQTKPIFIRPHLTNTLKLSFMIFVMFFISHGTFLWFPDFLVKLQDHAGGPKIICEIVGHGVTADTAINDCRIDNKNVSSFFVILVTGVFFLAASTILSFSLKAFAPKPLTCCWLILSTIACILINFVTDYHTIVICFLVFFSSGMAANIVMAVAVNLYPTHYRAMATSFILTSGRIGGAFGTNMVGLLLENNCTLIFYLGGLVLICSAIVFLTIQIHTKPAQSLKIDS